jgi:ribulose-5-phosphate 4-epimerase/fuculose-1-phosphate aldolase
LKCDHETKDAGYDVPVWNIAEVYTDEDETKNMLVNNSHLGSSLAAKFDTGEPQSKSESDAPPSKDNGSNPSQSNSPHFAVVLMSNHGFTALGRDIPHAVYRAIYTKVNASVQSKTTLQQVAEGNSEKIRLLGQTPNAPNEAIMRGAAEMNERYQDKPWNLWKREVQSKGLYRNNV